MEISASVKEKIVDFVIEKNLRQSLDSLPEMGNYSIEYKYQLAYNKKFEDKVFIVSEIVGYHNYSVASKQYGLYVFEKETGKQVTEEFNKNKGCYVGFFEELKIVEEII